MNTYLLAAENKTDRKIRFLPKKTRLVEWNEFEKTLLTKDESILIAEGAVELERAFRSLKESFYKHQTKNRKHSVLLLIGSATDGFRLSLGSLFRETVILPSELALPLDQLLEVLSSKNAAHHFVGGQVDPISRTVTLFRGDLSSLSVPWSSFRPSGNGVEPAFERLSFSDFGQTVCFGEYEASTDAILYEFDSIHRKKIKKERTQKDKSLGASLRRLRLQKGLRQSEFEGIDTREIGRIERDEVKPRAATLEKIAKSLNVNVGEIGSY